jgi:cytochrome c556
LVTDAIDALTSLNETTQAFEEAQKAAVAASQRVWEANQRLDEMQKEFDKFVDKLRENAPMGSYWHIRHGDS